MVLSLFLYGLALVLLIYIIFNIARTKKFTTGDAIATLGIIVSIILALNLTPLIIIPTKVPTQPAPTMSRMLYDDFNNSAFDGKYNNELWSISGNDSTSQVYQQGGRLVLSDIANTDEGGLILYLKKWKGSNFNFFQANVMLSNEYAGITGNITLNAVSASTHDIPGDWTEIGISNQIGNLPDIYATFDNGKSIARMNAQYNVSYTLRIEFDDKTNRFSYFVDNKLLTVNTVPTQGNNIQFDPSIQLWHDGGTSVKGFIDDVVIGTDK